MGEGQAKKREEVPMRSLVSWALLGLIIDRPSYAYEFAQRFDRIYEGALALSSISHVYVALGTLKDRGLIEEIAGTRSGRQPKPHYRATETGRVQYRDWLVEQIGDERQRQRLFVLQLAALARNPQIAQEVLARVEAACLLEAGNSRLPAQGGDGAQLVERLTAEEHRLALGARMAWIEFAREQLHAAQGGPGTR